MIGNRDAPLSIDDSVPGYLRACGQVAQCCSNPASGPGHSGLPGNLTIGAYPAAGNQRDDLPDSLVDFRIFR